MTNLDKVFKAYDIRGKYPEEINEEIAYKIGRATAKFLKARQLIIGQDNRRSSGDLFKCISEGVRDEGIDVIDIGLITTPMLYYSVIKYNLDGGIMITASHNPSNWNGFKIVREKAISLGLNSGLKKIKKIIEKDKSANWRKDKSRGELIKKDILKDYVEDILKSVDLRDTKPLKIFVDYSNGTANMVVEELFKNTSIKLINSISEKIDFGVIFDRDGDRIVFIDEKKQTISPDLITALIIRYCFKNAGKILHTVVASRIVREEIENNHNTPICSRVGHTFIKEKMEKEKITFGAESSGHYYFKNKSVLESPLTTLLMVIEIISKTGKTFSELVKPFQKYYLDRIDLKLKNVGYQVSYIIRKIEEEYNKYSKISKVDGLTIKFSDWWFNIRPSNTEPVLRLTIEAQTKELLEKKKKEISKLVPFFS